MQWIYLPQAAFFPLQCIIHNLKQKFTMIAYNQPTFILASTVSKLLIAQALIILPVYIVLSSTFTFSSSLSQPYISKSPNAFWIWALSPLNKIINAMLNNIAKHGVLIKI